MISARQMRAGRALLGWTAQELAAKAGTSLDAVHRLETEKVPISKARVGTIQKIEGALQGAGVVLLADGIGVTMKPESSREEEGGGSMACAIHIESISYGY